VKHWKILLPLILSLFVFYLFFRDIDQTVLTENLSSLHWGWLGLALFIKTISLCIHEYRLWYSIHEPRPNIVQTMQIGFSNALLNLIIPWRAGDLIAIAMLRKICSLRVGVATFAIGMVSFFEAAVFGLLMMVMMLWQTPLWISLIGEQKYQESFQAVTGLTLLGIGIVVIAAIIGRRFQEQESSEGFSPISWLKDSLKQTTQGLQSPRYLLFNGLASFIEVWLMIASFAIGFWVLGIDIGNPWTIAGLCLGFSALASIVLPPTYGAGTAASAIFLLGIMGISEEQAIAYAAVWWLISQLPAMGLGMPSLWVLRKWKD
jgi:hypothetical protein